MTTYDLRKPAPLLPTRDEVRDMLKSPAVAVAAIIGGTVVALGLLGVIGVLLYTGKDTTALLTLVNLVITGGAVGKLYTLSAKTERIEQQTNGTSTRLLDHALGQTTEGKTE